LIVDSVLTNAKAYINKELIACNIAIDDGKIFKISTKTHMPKADQKINLKNLLVLPGLIDPHVHLRDQGKSYKEDFPSGTSAAAAGGFTTVLDMPNNAPLTQNAETLKNRIKVAKNRILVNVGFYSEFPKYLNEIQQVAKEGAIAFKLFMARQVGGLDLDNDISIKQVLKQFNELNLILAVHAEDKSIVVANEKELKNKDRNTLRDFLVAHPEEAEYIAIKRMLKLNQEINAHIHFCHVTTKAGLDLIIQAKKTGLKITCEVTPNHLFLSDEDYDRYGPLLVMMPPIRSKNNVNALLNALGTGWFDVIGSDHAPHTKKEKFSTSVWDMKIGLPGLETTLPLLLTLVNKHQMSIGDIVSLLSEKPARIFNLTNRGKIEEGKKADLTIVDLKKKSKIDVSTFYTKAKYSPYNGWKVQGTPKKTIVNGSLVMDEHDIIAKTGTGSILRRS
jgi:dihydroorotase